MGKIQTRTFNRIGLLNRDHKVLFTLRAHHYCTSAIKENIVCTFEKSNTLYTTEYLLHIARNLLETRENIKISTHLFYPINSDLFSWG